MGSWCAASKHPWRHAQKFGGILQPKHLVCVRCSVAATSKLPALTATCLWIPAPGKSDAQAAAGAPVPHTYILWGTRSPSLSIPPLRQQESPAATPHLKTKAER